MAWWQRRQREQDLDRELRSHLELEAEEQREAGLSAAEARYAARRAFGNTALIKEVTREMWRATSFERLIQDLRYAIRVLLRSPGFSTVAVLSLALGIGANTAIFSLMNTIMLKMLPVKDPARLFLISHSGPGNISESSNFPLYVNVRDHNAVFSDLCAVNLNQWRVEAGGATETTLGQVVTGNYYSVLGVKAIRGRTLTPEDDRVLKGSPFAVISHSFWRRRFGLDPAVLGKTLTISGTPFTIVGVTPPEFFGLQPGHIADVTVPMSMHDVVGVGTGASLDNGEGLWALPMIGRLKPGVSPQEARANLDVMFQRFMSDGSMPFIAARRRQIWERVELTPAGNGLPQLRREFSLPLRVLMAMVGLVLLIACANVANLLLSKAAARQKEIAVRLAIGAGRVRLVRQLLTESLVLAGVGGALGLCFAWWGSNFLLTFLPRERVPLVLRTVPDAQVLLFTAGLSIVTGILFGLVPAMRATRIDLSPALKESARGLMRGGSRLSLAKGLVVAQVALSLLLLTGAGLFVGTLKNLKTVDTGYSRANILLFNIDTYGTRYAGRSPEAVNRLSTLYAEILGGLQATPGVSTASLSAVSPISGEGNTRPVNISGFAPRSRDDLVISLNWIGTRYFDTMGIPLLMGRDFTAADANSSQKVAVVSESMASFYFPGQNPLGKRFDIGLKPAGGQIEIVGVVKNLKFDDLRGEAARIVFVPYFQDAPRAMTFAVRTAVNPEQLISAVRGRMRSIASDVPVTQVRTLQAQIDDALVQERLIAVLSGFFGSLAIVLASIGLYGVMAYAVRRRTAEIGIRMALGASAADVVWMVVRETLLMILAGIMIGLPATMALTQLVSKLLFGLPPNDLPTLIAATVLLAAAAILAGYLPARRVAHVDPMMALRYE
jgi:predicted permease